MTDLEKMLANAQALGTRGFPVKDRLIVANAGVNLALGGMDEKDAVATLTVGNPAQFTLWHVPLDERTLRSLHAVAGAMLEAVAATQNGGVKRGGDR